VDRETGESVRLVSAERHEPVALQPEIAFQTRADEMRIPFCLVVVASAVVLAASPLWGDPVYSYRFGSDDHSAPGISSSSSPKPYQVDRNGTITVYVFLYESGGGSASNFDSAYGRGLKGAGVRMEYNVSPPSGWVINTPTANWAGAAATNYQFNSDSQPTVYEAGALSLLNPAVTNPIGGISESNQALSNRRTWAYADGSNWYVYLGSFSFQASGTLGDHIDVSAFNLASEKSSWMDAYGTTTGLFLEKDYAIDRGYAMITVVPEPPSGVALATLAAMGVALWWVYRRPLARSRDAVSQ
jgi:hypothetical protein